MQHDWLWLPMKVQEQPEMDIFNKVTQKESKTLDLFVLSSFVMS